RGLRTLKVVLQPGAVALEGRADVVTVRRRQEIGDAKEPRLLDRAHEHLGMLSQICVERRRARFGDAREKEIREPNGRRHHQVQQSISIGRKASMVESKRRARTYDMGEESVV